MEPFLFSHFYKEFVSSHCKMAVVQSKTKKKKLGSTRSGVVLFSTVLALTIIGFLVTLLAHAKLIVENARDNIELHVYLENDLNETNQAKLENIILNFGFINTEADVPVKYLSQRQYTNETKAKRGIDADFEKILGWNPIRACFKIKLKESYATANKLPIVKKELEAVAGIYEVDLSSEKSQDIQAVFKNLNIIFYVLGTFTLIAVFTISILINNTIKLALFSQRFLIRSMKLVGAEKSFIKKPFLRSATLQGAIAGIIAALFTFFTTQFFYVRLAEQNFMLDLSSFITILGGLIVLGSIIGFLGSLSALNKYLKMSLDDLY